MPSTPEHHLDSQHSSLPSPNVSLDPPFEHRPQDPHDQQHPNAVAIDSTPSTTDAHFSPKPGSRRPPPSPAFSQGSFAEPSALAIHRQSAYKRPRTVSPIIDDTSSDIEHDRPLTHSQANSEAGDYDGSDSFAPNQIAQQLPPTPLRESYSSTDLQPGQRALFDMSQSLDPASADRTVEGLMTEKSLSLDDKASRPVDQPEIAPQTADSETLPSYSDAMGQSVTDSLLTTNKPSGQEQLKTIRPMKNQPLVAGQTWYLISRDWYKRWSAACAAVEGEDAVTVGPIDNRLLLDEDSTEQQAVLKSNITEGIHYEMLPEQGWRLLFSWYGNDGPVFARKVIEGINPGNESVEFYPPTIRLLRLVEDENATGIVTRPFSMSVSTPLSYLKAETRRLLKLSLIGDTDIRFWMITEPTDAELRKGTVWVGRKDDDDVEVIEAKEKNLLNYKPHATLKELALDEKEMTLAAEVKADGRWPTDPAPLANAGAPKSIFAQPSGDFFTNLQQGGSAPTSAAATPAAATGGPLAASATDRVTRSQTANQRSLGLRGLNNLGNTCFMNSAVQCLSNTYELQQYFVSGVYRDELNVDNPLGMGGAIAEAFGSLIKNLWNGQGGSFWPREFKQALARFAPQFSGYAQHDTQELLAFLLDGLHEDLNRIIKKPYIEAPDWEGGDERDMVAFAKKQWDIYKARNDSVIVDLFQGQYRSTLVCPVCSKVSIKFDPFMYLTLPIPNKRKWRCPIYFVPFDPTKPTVKLAVQLPAGSHVGKLKQKVATHFGLDTKRLVCGELWQHRVFKWFDDYEPVIDIKPSGDIVYVWELPAESKPPRKSYSHRYYRDVADFDESIQIPDEDAALLPVFTTVDSSATGSSRPFMSRRSREDAAGIPFFVSVPRDQMNDAVAVQRIVAKHYRRFSEKPEDMMAYFENQVRHPHDDTATMQDWEMVDRSQNDGEAPVEIVHAPQASGPDSVTEIREDGEAVEVPDHSGINAASSAPAANAEEQQHSLSEGGSAKQNRAIKPLFTLRYMVADGSLTFPQGDSTDNMTEDFGERFARLSEVAARQTLGATISTEPTVTTVEVREGDDDKDRDNDSNAMLSPPSTPDSNGGRDGKGKEQATATGRSVPLLYTGGALVCTWTSAANEVYLTPGGSDTWGQVSEEMEAEFAKDSQGGQIKPKALSIEDCMDEFTKEEQLGEDDPWYCPSCKDFRQASKKFDLWKVPDILVVHLKRFSSGRHSRDKLSMNVDFPLESLDLSDRVEGPKAVRRLQKKAEEEGDTLGESVLGSGILQPESDNDDAVATDQPIYDLYAVDNHYGGLGGGHYTAYAKNPANGKWFEFDDSSVRPVSDPERVKTESAYLLFYRRRTTRPIGGKSRQKFQAAVREKEEAAAAAAAARAGSEASLPSASEATSVTVMSSATVDEESETRVAGWEAGRRMSSDEYDMFGRGDKDNDSDFGGAEAGSSVGVASRTSTPDDLGDD